MLAHTSAVLCTAALALRAVSAEAPTRVEVRQDALAACQAQLDGKLPSPTPSGFTWSGNVRTYYVAAEEIEWDYAPSGWDNWLGVPLDISPRAKMAGALAYGTKWLKALYRGYTDATFTNLTPVPAWQGTLGPTIRAEVEDLIQIMFVNRLTENYATMHSMGLQYTKAQGEGATYPNNTAAGENVVLTPSNAVPPAVAPGNCVVYKWLVDGGSGPNVGELSKAHSYHSYVAYQQDSDAGLIGPQIVYAKGKMNYTMQNYREFPLLYMIYDEPDSWLSGKNAAALNKKTKRSNPSPYGGQGAAAGQSWGQQGQGAAAGQSWGQQGQAAPQGQAAQQSWGAPAAPAHASGAPAAQSWGAPAAQSWGAPAAASAAHPESAAVGESKPASSAPVAETKPASSAPPAATAAAASTPASPSSAPAPSAPAAVAPSSSVLAAASKPESSAQAPAVSAASAPVSSASPSYGPPSGFATTYGHPSEAASWSSPPSADSTSGEKPTSSVATTVPFGGQPTTTAVLTPPSSQAAVPVASAAPAAAAAAGSGSQGGGSFGGESQSFDSAITQDQINNLWTGNQTVWHPQLVNLAGAYQFPEAPSFYTMNGFIFANAPRFEMCLGDNAIWYAMGYGSMSHVFHMHGNGFTYLNNSFPSISLNDGVHKTLYMTGTNPGLWQVLCHVAYHLTLGMVADYQIYYDGQCPLPSPEACNNGADCSLSTPR